MKVGIEMGAASGAKAATARSRGAAGDPPAGPGQFRLRANRICCAACLNRARPGCSRCVIDPEGDFVTLADRFGHVVVDAQRTEAELDRHRRAHPPAPRLRRAQSRGARCRTADARRGGLSQRPVRCRARPLVSGAGGGRRGAAFRARGRRRGVGRGPQGFARRDDQPDVPRPQARACRRHRHAAPRQARQERRGRGLQLPDGPHLPRHRHGARGRSARHGAPAGRDVPRSGARPFRGAWSGAVAPAAARRDRAGGDLRTVGQPEADAAARGNRGCPEPDLDARPGRGCGSPSGASGHRRPRRPPIYWRSCRRPASEPAAGGRSRSLQ